MEFERYIYQVDLIRKVCLRLISINNHMVLVECENR